MLEQPHPTQLYDIQLRTIQPIHCRSLRGQHHPGQPCTSKANSFRCVCCCYCAVAHTKEAEVDHVRFGASYKAMQFDPELLSDQRRRGWGDRQLTMLGIEHRQADGALLVIVVVERIDGKLLRYALV